MESYDRRVFSSDSIIYEGSSYESIFKDTASLAILQNSAAWNIEKDAKRVVTIPYLDWKSPVQDSALYKNQQLIEKLGDAWMAPHDGRLGLQLTREVLEHLDHNALISTCQILADFGTQMRKNRLLNFKIIDNCSYWDKAKYGIGGKATIEGPCMVPVREDRPDEGPWRRLMYVCFFLASQTLPSQVDKTLLS